MPVNVAAVPHIPEIAVFFVRAWRSDNDARTLLAVLDIDVEPERPEARQSAQNEPRAVINAAGAGAQAEIRSTILNFGFRPF